jgi:lysine 2,3-aminomutase
MGKVIVIESKSIHEYLRQIEELGEDPAEYQGLYGFSIGQTENRIPVYEYPEYDHEIAGKYSNLEV